MDAEEHRRIFDEVMEKHFPNLNLELVLWEVRLKEMRWKKPKFPSPSLLIHLLDSRNALGERRKLSEPSVVEGGTSHEQRFRQGAAKAESSSEFTCTSLALLHKCLIIN